MSGRYLLASITGAAVSAACGSAAGSARLRTSRDAAMRRRRGRNIAIPPRFISCGSWVRLIVDLSQVLKIQMRIDLRRADVFVAKQFLNGTQVARGLQQVRGKGVAQHVRMDMYAQPLLLCPARQAGGNAALGKAAPESCSRRARPRLAGQYCGAHPSRLAGPLSPCRRWARCAVLLRLPSTVTSFSLRSRFESRLRLASSERRRPEE